MRKKSKSGITLIELMIAVAIMGAVSMLAVVAMHMVKTYQKQWILVQMQREAQVNLYGIARDVRNADEIIHISSDTLVLRAFNFGLGFTSASLFDAARMGTITYRYQTQPGLTYLNRQTDFDGVKNDRILLRNMMVEPSVGNFVFIPYPTGATQPYDAVQITLRLGQGIWASDPRKYEVEAMKRARSD